jgi:inner membrane transporter RhtA
MSTPTVDTSVTPDHAPARTGAGFALVSMLMVQLGIAAAVGLFDEVGPLGAAWLRLAWAGLVMVVVLRPRPSQFTRE